MVEPVSPAGGVRPAAPHVASTPIRISHVITGLGVGGAEAMLLRLLKVLDPVRCRPHVIALSGDAPLAGELSAAGIPVDVLGIRPSTVHFCSAVSRLAQRLREHRPDIVQTWLYHADLVGGIVGRRMRLPVIWNIQAGAVDSRTIDFAVNTPRTHLVMKACAWTSRFLPTTIVSCSWGGAEAHRAVGYSDRFRVIPNGIDASAFKPDPIARRDVRSAWRVPDDVPIIGMVARFHPQKDHPNLLRAARNLIRTHPDVRFALCGLGLDPTNADLMSQIRASGLERHILLAGVRRDISRVMSAFDIHTLPSTSEGFPSVIGEAMAAGVPCVVTDVGDCARIVGETGVAVAPRDAGALADGWRALLDLPLARRRELAAAARSRIVARFSLTAAAAQYEELYSDTMRRWTSRGRSRAHGAPR
jgi:glycosyltransferase involved in cell wall biosynthesis